MTAATIASRLDLVLSWLDRVVGWLVVICMGTLTTVIVAQVVLRYGFNSSLDWGWALPRLAFICGIFLGMPLALKQGGHVGIDLLAMRLTPRGRRILLGVQLGLSALLMAVVLVFATRLAVQLWDQTIQTLPVSVGIFYAVLAFSAAHCLMHLARRWHFGDDETREGWEH